MDPEQLSGRPATLWWLLPLLVLICGLVLTALIAPRSLITVDQLTDEMTRVQHQQLSRTLERRLTEALTAAGELARGGATEFRSGAEQFLDRYPEISGLELLTHVSQEQRPRVEKTLSEQSGQPIRFATWDDRFASGVAPSAEQFLIVRQALFQAGTGLSDASLGLVATSVPHWQGALRRAQADNRPAATTLTTTQLNGSDLSALRIFVPVPDRGAEDEQLFAVVLQPETWLQSLLQERQDPRWRVELHDISQHARQPLATMPVEDEPVGQMSPVRSTLAVADRQWMLSTWPSEHWLGYMRQQALWPAWLTGLMVTLLASALTLWAVWLMLRTRRLLGHRTLRARHLGQRLENIRVEKRILHHSLQESDRRTQDLIDLGGGVFAELDENRHIGYISPQAATLLDFPTAELDGRTLDSLFSPGSQTALGMAFDAARRDSSIQRLDTEALTREGSSVPIALRIKALKDPLSGCTGFRVSLTPRQ